MVRVGVIGTGFGAKVHAPGWKSVPNATLVGIAGRTEKKVLTAAKKHTIRPYTSWQELVRDPSIDLVDIVVPPHLQAEILIAACESGKSILCEKPFCMSLAEAESILSMTEQKGVRHAIDFEFVFIPHFLYLKQLLEKKTIGDIRSISVTWLTGGQASVSTPLRWIHDSSQGGGVLGNYASHVLHYIEWFFGSISSVSGLLRTTKQASKIDAEDTCNITALLENNNIPTSILVSNVVYGGSGHTITINGTTGTLILQNSNVFDAVKEFELYHILPDQKPKKIPIPEAYGVVDQTLHDGRLYPFVQLASKFVAQDTDVPTFKDGVRSQKLIEAIQKSDAEKKWVTV